MKASYRVKYKSNKVTSVALVLASFGLPGMIEIKEASGVLVVRSALIGAHDFPDIVSRRTNNAVEIVLLKAE